MSRGKKRFAFEQVACSTNVNCTQALFNHYRDSGGHVAKRINDKRIRFATGHEQISSKTEDEASDLLRGPTLSIETFVGQHTARAPVFVRERISTVVKVHLVVKKRATRSLSGNSVLSAVHSILVQSFRSVIYFCFLRSMLRPKGSIFFSQMSSENMKAGRWFYFENGFKTPRRNGTNHRKISMKQTRYDAVKAPSHVRNF